MDRTAARRQNLERMIVVATRTLANGTATPEEKAAAARRKSLAEQALALPIAWSDSLGRFVTIPE